MPLKNFEHHHHHNHSTMSFLDLPELVLECILERVPPESLCSMSKVCSSLREMCMSDHLWGRHMKLKWGRFIGPSAYKEWKWLVQKDSSFFGHGEEEEEEEQGLMRYFSNLWPVSLVKSNLSGGGLRRKASKKKKKDDSRCADSIMAWYLSLERGKLWFPAQVYNRENGHAGFTLSCYDAELRYDLDTDTFQARYPPHGRRAVVIEAGVTWDRLRAPPLDTSPYDLHKSDCLNELRPGDHIEIQWRRNKGFPYGWWYGVVGHLGTCHGSESLCSCHESETVVLEFNQYALGSRWRRTIIRRTDHREEGDDLDGFYGGVRKLRSGEEISMWKQFFPAQVLE